MMSKISIGLGKKETELSSHASLAALAPVIEAKQIFAPIHEQVKIEQKQLLYSPSDKLIFVVLGILSGAECIFDLNLKLRPDKPLSLLPAFSRTKARKDMGEKFVDESLCTECDTCRKLCPYGAIELEPKPVFDMAKCYGCWSCYNHCPTKAVYTKKFRGEGHYPGPLAQLKEKLG